MKYSFLAYLILLSGAATALADVAVPSIFSDHAVLQRSAKTPVWGNADPGEEVKVSLGAASGKVTAGTDGQWMTTLDLTREKRGPQELIIEGKNRLAIADVIVGQVWLCSGQSNMEWTLKYAAGAKEEIAASADENLRCFRVTRTSPLEPVKTIEGKWMVAGPTTSGDFTAAGYFFAKKLQKELGVSIGLIDNSWGGASIESFMSPESLAFDPAIKKYNEIALENYKQAPALAEAYAKAQAAWQTEYKREVPAPADAVNYSAPDVSLAGWKKVTLPGTFASMGLPESGAIWFRRTIMLPEDVNRSGARLDLGPIADFDVAYVNGEKVGQTTAKTPGGYNAPRQYTIPKGKYQPGEATVAVRVESLRDLGGFSAPPERMRVRDFFLAGEWYAKVESELPKLSEAALASMPTAPPAQVPQRNTPTLLFNGMMNPLFPYGLEGILWYQGEANTGNAFAYRSLFPAMIADLRRRFGRSDLPFLFCQLANYQAKKPDPSESAWAMVREAQDMTRKVPATGQAVLIDIGEEADIHPKNKKDVGERLARIALAQIYGKNVVFSGPVFKSMQIKEGKAHLIFGHTEGGLVARPLPTEYQPSSLKPATKPLILNSPRSEVQGFAICGEDHQWVWANAVIKDNEVVVWSDRVPKPVAVRYAWADNPTCNLYNGVGLPAGPFRTDDFLPMTASD